MDRRKIDYIIELSLFGNPENLRISKLMLALNFVKRDLENVSVDIYIYASIHLKQYNWTVASLVYKTRRLYFRSPWRRHAGRGGSRASLSVRTEQVLPLHLEFCRGYTLTYISLSLTSPLGRHEPSLCRLHPRPVDVRLGKVSLVISQCVNSRQSPSGPPSLTRSTLWRTRQCWPGRASSRCSTAWWAAPGSWG